MGVSSNIRLYTTTQLTLVTLVVNIGKTTSGRPANVAPMQPHRSGGTRGGSHVRFQNRRGPAPAVRGNNSVFSQSILDSIREEDVGDVDDPTAFDTPFNGPEAARLEDPDLVPEDLSIYSRDFSRWQRPGGYMLRVEEMAILVDLANALRRSLGQDVLFLPSPVDLDVRLRKLNWSPKPGSPNERAQIVRTKITCPFGSQSYLALPCSPVLRH